MFCAFNGPELLQSVNFEIKKPKTVTFLILRKFPPNNFEGVPNYTVKRGQKNFAPAARFRSALPTRFRTAKKFPPYRSVSVRYTFLQFATDFDELDIFGISVK